jgi:hypothetical protein
MAAFMACAHAKFTGEAGVVPTVEQMPLTAFAGPAVFLATCASESKPDHQHRTALFAPGASGYMQRCSTNHEEDQ